MHKFDPYEYIGVIIPGVVVVITLLLIFPEIGVVQESGVTIGEFGLILILAIIAGHLVQAFGNAYERVVWLPFGGMPTGWVRKKPARLLSTKQVERLAGAVAADFECSLEDLATGRGPIRELNVMIRANGKPDRIDTFNRNYGLMRGVASALIIAAALVVANDADQWRIAVALLAAAGLATYRMTRFGEHYAREMFVEYLRCHENKKSDRKA